jgi:aryl-alcohol dehydrogenase-like predicted oxidoreductase
VRMRKLGALEVSELGFGILSFASTYGHAPGQRESIRVIRGAHDLGVTLFDTAEVYGRRGRGEPSDGDMAAIEARLAGIQVTGERLPPALLKVTNG